MKNKSALLTVVLLSSLFFSCHKKDNVDTPTCPFTAASITGSYKLTSIRYKANSSAQESENIGLIEICKRDDLYTLNANGNLIYSDAGMSCTPSSSAVGDWSISGNTLILDGVPLTFVSFNCTVLAVSIDNRVAAGDHTVYYYTKQ